MISASWDRLLATLLLVAIFFDSIAAAPPKPGASTSTGASIGASTSTASAKKPSSSTRSTASSTGALTTTRSTTTSTRSIVSSSASTNTGTSTFALPVATPSTTSVPASYFRGVNIGGWLILEPWMNPGVIGSSGAKDQLTFDATPLAITTLQSHWATYFTQGDVAAIAGYGMNALRIPIGYWAFDNSGTSFLSGAQLWLDQAISWARLYGMKVLVDVHGSPGSQNGWDHSGDASASAWQVGSNTSLLGSNMERNIQVLKSVSAKYGSLAYADVVYGIEIANEPISWAPNDFSVTKNWASVAYGAMMAVATNPNVQIIVHDGFMGPQNWWDLSSAINGNLARPQFAVDVHLYQNMVASDSSLDMPGHIQKACSWGNAAANSLMPVYVGEFSAAVNVCVNPDGSSFGNDGTKACTVAGCQCTDTMSIDKWSPALKNVTRMYWEAQLQSFEHANAGYFLWSFQGWGAWSLIDLYNFGIIGRNINERVYGKQCTYSV